MSTTIHFPVNSLGNGEAMAAKIPCSTYCTQSIGLGCQLNGVIHPALTTV